jgi:hypothetical protein
VSLCASRQYQPLRRCQIFKNPRSQTKTKKIGRKQKTAFILYIAEVPFLASLYLQTFLFGFSHHFAIIIEVDMRGG